MRLFDQIDFSGGLNAEFDRLKTPRNSYPLLLNGRIRNGNVQPVKKHLRDESIPAGNYQNIYVIGDYLIAFVSGNLLYKNLAEDSQWNYLAGWTPLDANVAEIYATLIPIGTNYLNVSGSPDTPTLTYNNRIAQTLEGLLVSDNVNQPRIIYPNLGWETLNTYSQWSQDNPEYVPIIGQSVVSGVKLFAISQNRKQIFQSVSGRYTDFVVNRDIDGNRGGDATTTAYAVDFNDITAMHPTQQGGLLVSTLYATYMMLPTDRILFDEPILSVGDLAFPIGAINWKSYASLLGDIAFIAQSGIHSINVSRQINRDSNNNPFSRTISRYLVTPQTDTCATSYGDYALFALNTTYGRGVFVYDTLREQFVSLDTGFGTVTKFAVYRSAGVDRLFFINSDNELYEAYGSTENRITRVLLGDFIYADEGVSMQMKVDNVFLWFNNITAADTVHLEAYADDVLIDSSEVTIDSDAIPNISPVRGPFLNQNNITPLKYGLPAREATKFSLWVSWQGNMELVGVSGVGSAEAIIQAAAAAVRTVTPSAILVIPPPAIHTAVADESVEAEISNLVLNQYYYVAGTAHLGGSVVTDGVFKAKMTTAMLTGKIYNITDFRDLWLTAYAESNRLTDIITLGNVTDGTEAAYDKFAAIVKPSAFYGPAANLDLDIALSAWYEHRERYFMHRTADVEFFIISGGWNSANDSVDSDGNPTGTSTEIDGYSQSSSQAAWLRYWLAQSTRRFKVVLIGYPPYTDESSMSPGFAPLRWPFGKWGADVVISRGYGVYERFYVNGFPYVNLGLGGEIGEFTNDPSRSVRRFNQDTGYIVLQPRKYALDILFKNQNGTVKDATTIYSA